jgi:hypothetical protein
LGWQVLTKHSAILLVSYHFYPSNEIGARRPTALARFLVGKGIRVIVVSAFGGQPIEPGSEVLPGVVAVPVRKPSRTFTDTVVSLKRRLHRAKAVGAGRGASNVAAPFVSTPSTGIFSQIRDFYFQTSNFIDEYKSWGRLACLAAIRAGKRHSPSLVLSSSPPPTVLWVGTLTARSLRVPHIADLRDPWSDAIAESHPAGGIKLALTRKLEGWVMRSASAITSTGTRVANLLIHRQPELASKTFVVRNGFDDAVRHIGSDTGGRLAIFFAGELYLNRDPFPLLHALERLLSRADVDPTRVRATFMGRKTEYAGRSFADWLEGKRCASVVEFLAPQSPEIVASTTLESTVVLNLAQHQPLSVPAKTFEHLASGRENLLLCEDESESAELVATIPGVVQVDPLNTDALDRVLLDLYDRHVRQRRLQAPSPPDVASFSRAAANDTFWRIIRSITEIDDNQETTKESLC